MKIVSIIILILMIAITCLSYTPASKIFFVGSSGDYQMDFAVASTILPSIFLLLFGAFLYYYFKNPQKIKLVFLATTLFFWILSGRTIGVVLWPDGRVSTGWFYIETERFNLCNHATDCETVVAYQTKIERLSFWRAKIKNDATNKTIFVGPLVWSKTLKMLNENIGAGKNVP